MSLTGTTVWLMVGGPILALDAPAADLVANPEVAELYLGGAPAGSGGERAAHATAQPADARPAR